MRAKNKVITQLIKDKVHTLSDHPEILAEERKYFQKLYSSLLFVIAAQLLALMIRNDNRVRSASWNAKSPSLRMTQLVLFHLGIHCHIRWIPFAGFQNFRVSS